MLHGQALVLQYVSKLCHASSQNNESNAQLLSRKVSSAKWSWREAVIWTCTQRRLRVSCTKRKLWASEKNLLAKKLTRLVCKVFFFLQGEDSIDSDASCSQG